MSKIPISIFVSYVARQRLEPWGHRVTWMATQRVFDDHVLVDERAAWALRRLVQVGVSLFKRLEICVDVDNGGRMTVKMLATAGPRLSSIPADVLRRLSRETSHALGLPVILRAGEIFTAIPTNGVHVHGKASRRIAALAADLAGPRRIADGETWLADLEFNPADGTSPLARRAQLKVALGFLAAAVRMRSRDAGRRACRPLDWLAATETRLSVFFAVAVLVPTGALLSEGGFVLLWAELEQVGVIGGFAAGAGFGWRRLRGITPKPPTSRGGDTVE